jgi:hypothetical protein
MASLAITARTVETREDPLPRGAEWEAVVDADRPVLFKGATADWPLVRAGLSSDEEAAKQLVEGWSGQPVVVYRGEPAIEGRFAYTPQVDGFNFAASREPLDAVLGEILDRRGDPGAPAIYVGSTDLGRYFPGLGEAVPLDLAAIHPMLAEHPGLASVWLGNRTTASCHYDDTHNIAVCAVGRRRFTLFPPDQAANLYPGPLEPTPGGQVISMVDLAAPDLERHPRFAEAMEAAQVAEMEPGDVLAYPAMWWHHVEALADFNVLVNFWWNAVPGYVDSPQATLLHALLALRDRPTGEKAAWRALFDYYVFGDPEVPRAHLPEPARGPLAPIDETIARRLRAQVTRKLQR